MLHVKLISACRKKKGLIFALLLIKIKIMILGVSEWLSSKLGWNTTHVRIAFVVSVLVFGAGIGLYLILWIVKMFSK